MAVYVPLHAVPLQFEDGNGNPLTGGTLEFYLAGTTTPTNLFSNSSGTSIGTSITLNSSGYPESGGNIITLFRNTAVNYKIIAKTAAGVTIWTADNLTSNLVVLASTTSGEGAALIGIHDAAGNYTATTVEGALAEIYSDLASTSVSLGASLVGVQDSAGKFAGATVEAVLAEIDSRLLRAYKTVSTARTATTTVANDPELVVAIPATGTYLFECFATVWGTTTGTQGIDANMNYSGTQSNGTRMMYSGYINGASLAGETNVAVATTTNAVTTTQADVGTTSFANHLHFKGILIAGTTGNLAFAWAQQASDANATNVGIGSWLVVTRVSA